MSRPKTRLGKDDPRPVLYQLCRAGERFEVGDGPVDLTSLDKLVLGRGDANKGRAPQGRLFVDDPWMSSSHAQLSRDAEGRRRVPRVVIEDLGSTNGVLVNGEPVKRASLEHGDVLETGRTFWIYLEEPGDLSLPREPVEFGTWTTWSPRLAYDLRRLEVEVDAKKHLLLTGPEGTGKGFLARTVHLMSGRPGRLVHLDCRERKPKRLLVDLFGGEGQGARLSEADLGTLFLEHADALPLEIQDRLIESLRHGSFVPGNKTRRVSIDVRVVASTTLEPDEAVARGKLRSLFVETLSELVVRLPGLDERRADLGLLLDDFLARARGAQAISREACRAVLLHPWRMHVKAFARVLESAAVLAADTDENGRRTGTIELVHLPALVTGGVRLEQSASDAAPQGRPPSIQDVASGVFLVERGQPDEDPDRTDGLGIPPVPTTDEPSDAFMSVVADLEDVVEQYDALDATDPSVRHQGANRLVVPKWDGSLSDTDSGSSGPAKRPPSAYHDMQEIERSYAAAIDPDLIVDALKRARGNVSAAARYLGKPRALVLRWMKEFQIRAERYR